MFIVKDPFQRNGRRMLTSLSRVIARGNSNRGRYITPPVVLDLFRSRIVAKKNDLS